MDSWRLWLGIPYLYKYPMYREHMNYSICLGDSDTGYCCAALVAMETLDFNYSSKRACPVVSSFQESETLKNSEQLWGAADFQHRCAIISLVEARDPRNNCAKVDFILMWKTKALETAHQIASISNFLRTHIPEKPSL